jgi:uncharacterized protein YyaL (SSP411 family)
MLCVLDFYLQRPKEIVLLGNQEAQETKELLARIHSIFLPHKTIACFNVQEQEKPRLPSLLAGRTQVDGKLTAYVCDNFTCSLPVTDWGALKELLET